MIRIVPTTIAVKHGIDANETGINIRRFQVRYFPEVDIRHQNLAGETFLRSVSSRFSREVVCEGEIKGTTGIMDFTLGIACVFANIVSDFGPSGGSFLLDDATVSQERRGWKSVAVRASANPLL